MRELDDLIYHTFHELGFNAKSFNRMAPLEQGKVFNTLKFEVKSKLLGNPTTKTPDLARIAWQIDGAILSILFEA